MITRENQSASKWSYIAVATASGLIVYNREKIKDLYKKYISEEDKEKIKNPIKIKFTEDIKIEQKIFNDLFLEIKNEIEKMNNDNYIFIRADSNENQLKIKKENKELANAFQKYLKDLEGINSEICQYNDFSTLNLNSSFHEKIRTYRMRPLDEVILALFSKCSFSKTFLKQDLLRLIDEYNKHLSCNIQNKYIRQINYNHSLKQEKVKFFLNEKPIK